MFKHDVNTGNHESVLGNEGKDVKQRNIFTVNKQYMVHYCNNTYIYNTFNWQDTLTEYQCYISILQNNLFYYQLHSIVKCITGDSNGNLRAQIPNPAVSDELLTQIMAWKSEGARIDDIITRLRMRTVPARHVHTIHSWIDG